MLDYLIRRLIGTVPVLLAVSAFVFLFVHLLPGDPARLVAGPDASLQEIAAVTRAPLSTVKSRLYRGLAAIKPQLEDHNFSEATG